MNPTIYEIKSDDHDAVMHIVDHSEKRAFSLAIINKLLNDGKTLYGSYYRPGEFWAESVFVCPKCAHATQEDDFKGEFWCKYCYTQWEWDKDQGWVICS